MLVMNCYIEVTINKIASKKKGIQSRTKDELRLIEVWQVTFLG